MTKGADFVELVEQHGPPPQVILVTCGNTSNLRLRRLLESAWPTILPMIERRKPWSNSVINRRSNKKLGQSLASSVILSLIALAKAANAGRRRQRNEKPLRV